MRTSSLGKYNDWLQIDSCHSQPKVFPDCKATTCYLLAVSELFWGVSACGREPEIVNLKGIKSFGHSIDTNCT